MSWYSSNLQGPDTLDSLSQAHVVVVEVADAEEADNREELERIANDRGQLGAMNVVDDDAVKAPIAVKNERGAEQTVRDRVLEHDTSRYGGEQDDSRQALVVPLFGVRLVSPMLIRTFDRRLLTTHHLR